MLVDTISIDLNAPTMPAAWIKSYRILKGKKGRVFAKTTKAPTDWVAEGTRSMLVKAAYRCLGLKVSEESKFIGN